MTPRRTHVHLEDIDDLGVGCGILGTGGGGGTYPGELMAKQVLEEHGPVRLVTLDDLDPEGLILPIGTIGAPTVSLEKLPAGTEAALLRAHVEERFRKRVAALMPVEIGGSNGVKPVAYAGLLDLPIIDGDAMGRAFPEVQMVSMNVAGLPPGIVLLCDPHGNIASFEPVDELWAERLARTAAVSMGGSAVEIDYIMSVAEARGAIVEGSITRAIEIGRALRGRGTDGVAALVEHLGAFDLIEGKIVDVERTTSGGFVRGSVTIEGTGDDSGRLLRVEIQNENLAAFEDGRMVCCVPDLISLVDDQSGEAVPTEVLRFGQRVAVIALPCDPLWRTPRGLDIAGPRAFGYDIEYVPVEEVASAQRA
ncbi:DUF917 domain-containing protein [Conexibacter woesei]|uniref:DUF917 domain-containing protein n=1 Tax=Conexibacter woesei TaxID=191495 RepID=UPI00040D28EB|nr:DUF917 domain-containing protein [Conexibacter woesei]